MHTCIWSVWHFKAFMMPQTSAGYRLNKIASLHRCLFSCENIYTTAPSLQPSSSDKGSWHLRIRAQWRHFRKRPSPQTKFDLVISFVAQGCLPRRNSIINNSPSLSLSINFPSFACKVSFLNYTGWVKKKGKETQVWLQISQNRKKM